MNILHFLSIIACVSPLLTLTALWQKKEWRIDRLKEHLRSEGWFRQIFGILRPSVVIATLIVRHQIFFGLLVLAGLSILQIAVKRQRKPVWTMKAIVLTGTALLLTIGIGMVMPTESVLLILPLAQSVTLLCAWILFLPVDSVLKKHILRKATELRRSYEHLTVIGITGSVGKTTTKELLAHILKEKNILFTPAYVNSEMGVAKWILQELPKKDRDEEGILVIEMGAYRTGEIEKLCHVARPHIGIITFIGSQHIGLFGSQEKLRNAKSELFRSLPEDGHAFTNIDCALCGELPKLAPCPTTTVGTAGQCDVEATHIEETGTGIRFTVAEKNYTIPLHGTHNVTNVLLAIGVARYVGMSDSEIQSILQTFTPPHSTFSVRTEHNVTLLDDTHNASPESFRAAIAWAKAQPAKRKILITPGLIELGDNEDRIHQELGMQASGIFSRVIFTGKHGMNAFAKGYTGQIEQLHSNTSPVQSGDLLACVGRVHTAIIQRILPQ